VFFVYLCEYLGLRDDDWVEHLKETSVCAVFKQKR
jgi:hypothetical protein